MIEPLPQPPRVAVVLVAAGQGLRAGGGLPKQWRPLAGRPVAERSAAAFRALPGIGPILCVMRPDDIAAGRAPDGCEPVPGGSTRAHSVRAGLERLDGAADLVLVHDAARPLVSAALVGRVLAALDRHDAAAPALPVTDALWTGGERVTGTRDRTGLWRAQTPQGFRLAPILAAHRAHRGDAADDVEVARAAGLEVAIVRGDEDNLKITTADDFARAERILAAMTPDRLDIRTGTGFDVHRFGAGDHVMLCGVRVPHPRGLQGHSDADVGLHAAADAIYGALADGDIGRHFPPSEARWKGADSAVFLRHAAGRIAARGFRLTSLDVTLVCEAPRIGPYAEAMAARLAELLGAGADRVSVKATTTERLGFAGRGEGIACLATVTLVAP